MMSTGAVADAGSSPPAAVPSPPASAASSPTAVALPPASAASRPTAVPSPPASAASTARAQPAGKENRTPAQSEERAAQRRRVAGGMGGAGLRIEISSPAPEMPRSPSPFRMPRLPSPARAVARPPPIADLRAVADHHPLVALKIFGYLDAASLTSLGLASTRLNDLSEIAARWLVLRSKGGVDNRSRINPGFAKFSARSRWKRLAQCTEIVENFASLACVQCPISAEQVLAYLGCFRVQSLRGAIRETQRMQSDRCKPADPVAQSARGVARFMAGWLVPALFDFLSAHGRLFINCGHDTFSGCPTMRSQQIARVRAEAACPEGFAFSGRGLGRHPGFNPSSNLPTHDALTLARLCVLKLFMPPWFGLEPLTTPRVRTPRSTPTFPGSMLPRHPGSVDGRARKAFPLPPASSDEKRLAANLLCGMCHPDEWLRATTQAGIPTNESAARLALPICAGPKVLLGRVFDCSCFVMSGADSPVVAFLATASDGLQVTVRDAWLAIWQNMPWVSLQLRSFVCSAHRPATRSLSSTLTHFALSPALLQCDHIHLSGISASSVIASGVIDLSGAFQEEPHDLE